MNERLGIISGAGDFPVLIARKAKEQGYSVFCAAVGKSVSEDLGKYSDKMESFNIGKISAIINFFKKNAVSKVIMAGLVKHTSIFSVIPDLRAAVALAKLKDTKTETLLSAIKDEFAKDGIEFINPHALLKDSMAKEGALTKTDDSKQRLKDIRLGWKAAKTLADIDAGLTVVVARGAIVAMEGMEGTDECILRAGEIYARSASKSDRALTVVKVARTAQDMRFDLPVIGIGTIESMNKAGASVLVIESGKTLIIDEQKTLALADKLKITVLGLSRGI